VVRELKKEGSIRLAGLGVFRKRKLAARVGRNPATGEQIRIPARTRLRFTPAKALKESDLGGRSAGSDHVDPRYRLRREFVSFY
jgi:nucleoid DNA-binding protein